MWLRKISPWEQRLWFICRAPDALNRHPVSAQMHQFRQPMIGTIKVQSGGQTAPATRSRIPGKAEPGRFRAPRTGRFPALERERGISGYPKFRSRAFPAGPQVGHQPDPTTARNNSTQTAPWRGIQAPATSSPLRYWPPVVRYPPRQPPSHDRPPPPARPAKGR